MPIEFVCQGCGKSLRVQDDASGKQARCPNCGHLNAVPLVAPSPELEPQRDASQSDNPYAAPATAMPQVKPSPQAGGPIVNVPVDVGQIMNHAWQVWRDNLGLLVGVTLVVGAINLGLAIPLGIAQAALEEAGERGLAGGIGALGQIASNLISIYLGIGQVQISLALARGQQAEFGQLFAGGPRFIPVFVVSLLLGLLVVLGMVACIVPGVLLAIMFWPAYYLAVDGKADIIESFSVARIISENNWLTIVAMAAASMGITLVGLLAFCVGVIFAAPLVTMLWTSGYLMMSGQLAGGQDRGIE